MVYLYQNKVTYYAIQRYAIKPTSAFENPQKDLLEPSRNLDSNNAVWPEGNRDFHTYWLERNDAFKKLYPEPLLR